MVTINLQHLYEARINDQFRKIIFTDCNAQLCIDGRGAQILLEKIAGHKLPRAVGNEILKTKLEEAINTNTLVIGSNTEIIAEVRKKFNNINFSHNYQYIQLSDKNQAIEFSKNIANFYGYNFSLIIIALGVPKQEIIANAITTYYPEVPILCIGGSLEMLAGKYRRAPIIIQNLGLEGFWRFLIQPSCHRLSRLILTYWYFLYFLIDSSKIRKLIGNENE